MPREEESEVSSVPSVNSRPNLKPRTFSNAGVPLAPTVMARMGLGEGGVERTLSPELFPYIASLLNIDLSELVEEQLQTIANSGRDEPVQFLTVIDMEVGSTIDRFRSLDYGIQPTQTFEIAKKIAALFLAHATILNCWHQRLSEGPEGEQWKVAH